MMARLMVALLSLQAVDSFFSVSVERSSAHRQQRHHESIVSLRAVASLSSPSGGTLKDVSTPLMNSGKALARTGELIIDYSTTTTTTMSSDKRDVWGNVAAAGAQVRNSGDCVAQAAASCRFKTGVELVTDELREAATCLATSVSKLQTAVAAVDDTDGTKGVMETMIGPLQSCSDSLEAAGAALLQRHSLGVVGRHLVTTGQDLSLLSTALHELSRADAMAASDCPLRLGSQRCRYASEQMILAGAALVPPSVLIELGVVPITPTAKSWLKQTL